MSFTLSPSHPNNFAPEIASESSVRGKTIKLMQHDDGWQRCWCIFSVAGRTRSKRIGPKIDMLSFVFHCCFFRTHLLCARLLMRKLQHIKAKMRLIQKLHKVEAMDSLWYQLIHLKCINTHQYCYPVRSNNCRDGSTRAFDLSEHICTKLGGITGQWREYSPTQYFCEYSRTSVGCTVWHRDVTEMMRNKI